MNKQIFAIVTFSLSGFAAIICWSLAHTTFSTQWKLKSKRWLIWTIIFSALTGFSMCPAMSDEGLLFEEWWLSMGMAVLVVIGMLTTIWMHNYSARVLDRDLELIRSAQRQRRRQRALQNPSSRKPAKTAVALGVIGLAGVIGWLFWQKRRGFHKSK